MRPEENASRRPVESPPHVASLFVFQPASCQMPAFFLPRRRFLSRNPSEGLRWRARFVYFAVMNDVANDALPIPKDLAGCQALIAELGRTVVSQQEKIVT